MATAGRARRGVSTPAARSASLTAMKETPARGGMESAPKELAAGDRPSNPLLQPP